MTEYQIATLDLREWTMWIAAAALVVSAVVGGFQCFLIWRGLVIMRRAADARDRALDNQRREADRRHAEAMQVHAEAMQAMAEARREADRRHAEAMQAADRRHAEAMQAMAERHAETMAGIEAQSRALETLIERTAPQAQR